MNPMQLLQMIRGGQNPQQLFTQMLGNSQDPMTQNLAQLIQNQDGAGLETFARNLVQSQGKDFDKEFASFRKTLGL